MISRTKSFGYHPLLVSSLVCSLCIVAIFLNKYIAIPINYISPFFFLIPLFDIATFTFLRISPVSITVTDLNPFRKKTIIDIADIRHVNIKLGRVMTELIINNKRGGTYQTDIRLTRKEQRSIQQMLSDYNISVKQTLYKKHPLSLQ